MIHSDLRSQISTYAATGRKLAMFDRNFNHQSPKATKLRIKDSQNSITSCKGDQIAILRIAFKTKNRPKADQQEVLRSKIANQRFFESQIKSLVAKATKLRFFESQINSKCRPKADSKKFCNRRLQFSDSSNRKFNHQSPKATKLRFFASLISTYAA